MELCARRAAVGAHEHEIGVATMPVFMPVMGFAGELLHSFWSKETKRQAAAMDLPCAAVLKTAGRSQVKWSRAV